MTINNCAKIWEDIERSVYAALYCISKPSANAKTGDMLQLAIMPLELSPTQAQKQKQQHNCGTGAAACPITSICYVNTVSLVDVWKKTAGEPVQEIPQQVKPLRLGSWGDPGLLPLELLEQLTSSNPYGHTGYTHLWPHIDAKYSKYLMASVDQPTAQAQSLSIEQLTSKAHNLGYRTYRIKLPGQQLNQGEIECLASSQNKQCRECKQCNGTRGRFTRSIAIDVHGAPNKIAVLKKLAA